MKNRVFVKNRVFCIESLMMINKYKEWKKKQFYGACESDLILLMRHKQIANDFSICIINIRSCQSMRQAKNDLEGFCLEFIR